MKKLLGVIIVIFALAGCSLGPQAEPGTTTPKPTTSHSGTTPGPSSTSSARSSSTPSRTPSASPSQTPSKTPTPTPKPTIEIPAGACLAPNEAVLAWARNLTADPQFPAESVVMVSAGSGNRADETWDVVALPVYAPATGKTILQSYLTNAASASQPSGESWIDLGTSDSPIWTSVTWSGDRLTAGQQAQQIAFACLGQ